MVTRAEISPVIYRRCSNCCNRCSHLQAVGRQVLVFYKKEFFAALVEILEKTDADEHQE